MRLLDLFCGAGGCSVGYHRAGFTEIVGVDNRPMPRYPFAFVQADALEYLAEHGHEFDFIHASPPCQRYSRSRTIHDSGNRHADLVAPTRALLQKVGRPYVIENVTEAPVHFPVVLCGLMFGLRVLRHRKFESSLILLAPEHRPHPKGQHTGTSTRHGNGYSSGEHGLVCVAGNNFRPQAARDAMGIDWMRQKELAQAIPPAYTEYLGRQIIRQLQDAAA